jgi:hypothetical protein
MTTTHTKTGGRPHQEPAAFVARRALASVQTDYMRFASMALIIVSLCGFGQGLPPVPVKLETLSTRTWLARRGPRATRFIHVTDLVEHSPGRMQNFLTEAENKWVRILQDRHGRGPTEAA